MIESLMKNKAIAIFSVFCGVIFVFYGGAYWADYFLTGWSTPALLETILYAILDTAVILAGITLWVIATKILTAKS
jgi:hypothetical protein